MKKYTFKKSKNRVSRTIFCEWNSESFGHYDTGGIICRSCNFSRTLLRKEDKGSYELNNKISKPETCPKCHKVDWYYLPSIARRPKLSTSKKVWKKFWKDLTERRFNHPEKGCR